MSTELSPLALPSLLHKAAVDAGFDLQPELDGMWWRLRASGAPGVAWVRPANDVTGAWLALPIVEQLAIVRGLAPAPPTELGTPLVSSPLPAGATGAVFITTAGAIHDALRRVWSHRAHTPERLAARWEAEVAAALGTAVDPSSGGAALRDDVPALTTTEVVAAVRRRVGQDLFREALLDLWEGRCAVTGLAVPELLRASHAKPWAVATDTERMDPHNGLLLAVHLDALFDRGFVTFTDEGAALWSGDLGNNTRALLGLPEGPLSLRRLELKHCPYLAWHREHVFRP